MIYEFEKDNFLIKNKEIGNSEQEFYLTIGIDY